ncbi:hypothetical protein CTI12_AA379550 [Artemisia annua]|uniref:Glycine-rich protein n=1 Tax=Artemisia annua TaxID=35608 RepID=A0A2U1MHH6_ARTAN|nr:hypothetical protein CTI12_AA379550 [Artemisia annua]
MKSKGASVRLLALLYAFVLTVSVVIAETSEDEKRRDSGGRTRVGGGDRYGYGSGSEGKRGVSGGGCVLGWCGHGKAAREEVGVTGEVAMVLDTEEEVDTEGLTREDMVVVEVGAARWFPRDIEITTSV